MIVFAKGYRRCLFSLLILSSLIPGCSPDKEFKFTFSRKDGETYIQRLSISRERHMSPTDIQMDDTLSVTKVICKKTEKGWDINAKPQNRIMMRNGKEVKNPLLELLSEFVITYRLNEDGELKNVIGYENVLKAIKSQYLPEVAEGISSSFDIDALKQKELTEWNGRIGNYLNKKFSIGDVWEFETPFILPNGVALTYKVKTHFKELVQYENIRCVLIEQTYDSSGDGISDLMNDVTESLSNEGEIKDNRQYKVNQVSTSIKGKVSRLIDPSTMNIYKEEVERTILMEMDVPGAGQIPVKMIEKRTYDYDYVR